MKLTKFYSDDFLFKNIRSKDNHEKLVYILKYTKKAKIRNLNVLKKKKEKVFVREKVAKMLREAEKLLPKEYHFIIYDGYRNYKTQKKYFDNYLRLLKRKNPDLDKIKLFLEAEKYVANPDKVAPHMTGGAIDISLGKGKKQIEMGGFIEGKDKETSCKIKKNRELLKKILEKAGFVNYPLEWWHFSYGDRYYSAVKKKKFACYQEITRI
jgi:D-alanyl-D-alanine dipeptidase